MTKLNPGQKNSRWRWFRFYRSRGYPIRLAWRVAKRRRLLIDPGKVRDARR